jgi:hypothetical protein
VVKLRKSNFTLFSQIFAFGKKIERLKNKRKQEKNLRLTEGTKEGGSYNGMMSKRFIFFIFCHEIIIVKP